MATIGTTTTTSSTSGLAALSTASSTSSTTSNGKEIAGNFQDFLLLLTTQLKNQSPLDPLDTNQFTQQLVQFAGVEQQLKGNDTLSSILSSLKTSSSATAASYVGMKVTADGGTATLSGGAASWTLNSPKAAARAVLSIKNSDGTVVATRTQSLTAGSQSFTWNGKDAGGNALADGSYTLAIAAVDASGQAVTVGTDVSGTVTAVDVSATVPVLTVGGATVPLTSVKTIATQ